MNGVGDWLAVVVALVLVVPFFLYLAFWLVGWVSDIRNGFSGRPTDLSGRVTRAATGRRNPNATDPSEQ